MTPARLTEIEGIGPKKADQIIEAAREYMFEMQSNKAEAEQLESEDEEEKVVRVTGPRKAADLFIDNMEDENEKDN